MIGEQRKPAPPGTAGDPCPVPPSLSPCPAAGLCYLPPDDLEGRLAHHNLQLVGSGVTHFTRWFVARQAGGEAGGGWLPAGPHGAQQPSHFIFLRGVSWRSADLDALRVWQSLLRALPSPFLPHLTAPPDLLVAHRLVGCCLVQQHGKRGPEACRSVRLACLA